MDENMVSISKDEYEAILELAYKAAMLKEAILNAASLSLYGDELFFGGGNGDVATIFKYAFPDEYQKKLRELMDNKKAKEGRRR